MRTIQTVLIVISLMVFVHGAFELETAPGICSRTLQIQNGGVITQTLCHVKQDLTSYQAKTICEKNGMRLADPSSQSVVSALQTFAATFLKSSRAEVFVSGRTYGRCRALTGDGKFKSLACTIPSNFICEFFKPKTPLQCTTFSTQYVTDPLVLSTGITNPQNCLFSGTIANIYTELFTTTAVAKERVIIVTLSGTNVAHLPINLASNFPNVNLIEASGCRISTILPQQLQGLTQLTSINLLNNLLTSVTSDVFSLVPNLRQLVVEGNPLTTISSDIFTVALPLLHTLIAQPAGCINQRIQVNRPAVAALPGSSTSCTIV